MDSFNMWGRRKDLKEKKQERTKEKMGH